MTDFRNGQTPADKSNPVARALAEASAALGFRDHIAVGNIVPHARELVPAVGGSIIHLDRAAQLSSRSDQMYRVDTLPAGETIDISATIIERSRVARAGARVIIAAEKPSPSAGMAFYTDVGMVRAVDPVPFAAVADGANAPTVPFPFHDVLLSWKNAPSLGISIDIPRSKQRDVGGGEALETAIFMAILEGIALAADKALLAAIMATNPAVFGFGAAAGRNLAFANLRGLVGTAGAGATIATDGTLRAGGVPAELTSGAASTIVGAFGRAAVAIRPEVYLRAKRLDRDGNLNLSAFVSIQGLVPDASTFWAVS